MSGCRHFISDCACGVNANFIPDEDCEHCPIPSLEKKVRQLQRDLRKAKKNECHHHPIQVRSDREVRDEIRQQDIDAKKEMSG